MSILDTSLRKAWDSLRARKQVQNDFLDEVRLKGLRGIRNLRVAFDYPVSVLAGPNGCGKSTVLFACAAAYAPAGGSARTYTPAALFPGFSDRGEGEFVDEAGGTGLEFYYLAAGVRYSMVWKKGRSWSRGFMGRKGVRQPERALYLRTLANLTNPSEVRGILQLGRGTFEAEEITPDLLLFARRILPQKYRGVSLIRGRGRDLLFAGLDHRNAVRYSEFHMSAGERAILRMSKDISGLKRALILIDEVEAGLHPSGGGTGLQACSGDMLLQALVACAGVTLRAVATALSIDIRDARVSAEGDLDVRGTLGVDREAPVGFRAIRLHFALESDAAPEDLDRLYKLTERYCVVYQTLTGGAPVTVSRSDN